MKLEQNVIQVQRLALTQAMRQSLNCLQMSALELNEYVQEIALSNPVLEVQPPAYYEVELPNETPTVWDKWRDAADLHFMPQSAEHSKEFSDYFAREKTFREHLYDQIGQTRLVDDKIRNLCIYLIDCLDERGYLDCPVEELAKEVGCSVFSLEQALYAVQMLDPPGVGARNLSECLVLQLAQTADFNRLTLAIAQEELALLGERRYGEIASHLNVSVSKVKQASKAVLALNPIPARGFSSGRGIAYVVPDAILHEEHGAVTIELNEQILPRISVNGDYAQMLKGTEEPEVSKYLTEKIAEAQTLVKSVRGRCDTFLRIIRELVDTDRDYFCRGGALCPITMQQLAEKINVSVSTVSRAAQNKYIEFQGQIIPVRSLFVASLRSDDGVSAHSAKQRLRALIQVERADAPLSDEALCQALAASGIYVSRRAVAKYRADMGIPSSTQRRQTAK